MLGMVRDAGGVTRACKDLGYQYAGILTIFFFYIKKGNSRAIEKNSNEKKVLSIDAAPRLHQKK